jgi:hypothetical protein
MSEFGTNVVDTWEDSTFGGPPDPFENIMTSGDLKRASLRGHDFDDCPFCGSGVLTSHRRRKDNGIVRAEVFCKNDLKCGARSGYSVRSLSEIATADAVLRERWNRRA